MDKNVLQQRMDLADYCARMAWKRCQVGANVILPPGSWARPWTEVAREVAKVAITGQFLKTCITI